VRNEECAASKPGLIGHRHMRLISNAASSQQHSRCVSHPPLELKYSKHILYSIYFVQNIHDELKIMQRIKNLTSAYPLSATPATRGGFPGVFPGFSRLPQRHFQYLNFDIFCI